MESTAINNASVIYSQSTTTPQAEQDPLEHPLREASERVDPIIEAVTEVDRINVDIAGAVQTTLSVVPGVVALRPTLVQNGLFDITHLDNLRDYALALAYAQSRYRTAVGTPDTTAVEHLVKMRARLTLTPLHFRSMVSLTPSNWITSSMAITTSSWRMTSSAWSIYC